MFKKGDFILIDYVAKVDETGQIIDLTLEEVAKKEKVYRSDGAYEPKLVVLGEGWFLRGLEEGLEQADVGMEKVIAIPPEKAFGVRDPAKVRTISARELTRKGITPRVGAQIELDGQPAVIRSMGGGRAVADFNHPLAGKTIIYQVKVLELIKEDVEKILNLIHRRISPIRKDRFKVLKEGGVVTIEMPEESFTFENLQFAKRALAKDIQKLIPEVHTVKFIETYIIKEKLPTSAMGEASIEKPK